MKWRPIGELSDEQRDGRVWLFSDDDIVGIRCEAMRFIDIGDGEKDWVDSAGSSYAHGVEPEFKWFLSQPLPETPKPLKMEWRKFEDEVPSAGRYILVVDGNNELHIGTTLLNGYLYNQNSDRIICIDKLCHWMPIVPPEGE